MALYEKGEMKPKRKVDKDLIDFVKTLPCLCCTASPVDAHHVTHQGAGGGDIATNLMPLCRRAHQEWHKIGPYKMCEKYPSILEWLIRAGRDDVLERMQRGTK